MPGRIKVNGVWKSIPNLFVKTQDLWAFVDEAYIKENGQWKKWFETIFAPSFSVSSRTTTSLSMTISNYSAIKNQYPSSTFSISTNVSGATVSSVSSTGTFTVSNIPSSNQGRSIKIEGITIVDANNSSRISSITTVTQPTAPTTTSLTALTYNSFSFVVDPYLSSPVEYEVTPQTPGVSTQITGTGTTRTITATGLSNPNTTTGAASTAIVHVISKIPDPQNTGSFISSPTTAVVGSGLSILDPSISQGAVSATSFSINLSNTDHTKYNYKVSVAGVLDQYTTSNSFTYTNASPSTSYSVSVRAEDKSNANIYTVSNTISITTSAAFSAVGGTIVENNSQYTTYKFTSTGSFTLSVASNVSYSIVGGGGAGASWSRSTYNAFSATGGPNGAGGGGGGGCVHNGTFSGLNTGTYTISIGAGGAGSFGSIGQNGNSSSISGIQDATAPGGYRGGGYNGGRGLQLSQSEVPSRSGAGGGSAAWATWSGGIRSTFSPNGGYGNTRGGNGAVTGSAVNNFAGGGGGGSSSSGSLVAAGSGSTLSFGDSLRYAAGGQAAGGGPGSSYSLDGAGGGQEQFSSSNPTSGSANRGGGGGGGHNFWQTSSPTTSTIGGNGGSGVVFVRIFK